MAQKLNEHAAKEALLHIDYEAFPLQDGKDCGHVLAEYLSINCYDFVAHVGRRGPGRGDTVMSHVGVNLYWGGGGS